MKSKDIFELLDEFLSLGWYWDRKRELEKNLKDLQLYPGVWLRKYKGNWTIEYLPVGSRMEIPSPWPAIWSEFCVWGGSRVMDWSEEVDIEEIKDNKLLYFCYTFFKLVTYIEQELCNASPEFGNMWEEEMEKLCEIGTKDFREWIEQEHNLKLQPWEIDNFENGKKEI